MNRKPLPLGESRASKKKLNRSKTSLRSEAPTAPPSIIRFLPWAIVLLAVVLAVTVRIRLLETPLERDEGEYAYAGQLILQGIPPYQAAFNMKFPGVYAAYALIMAAFGQTIAGIHLGFLLLNAGTVVLMFILGRRLFTTEAGAAAAAAYALLSLGAGVYGTHAHATHFVVAAALGATWLLLYAIDTGNAAVLFSSGLLYGVAILMKQPGAFFAIFGGLCLVWDRWSQHRGAWPASLRRLAIFLLGVAVPLALTALALWRAGVFSRFWFWTISYAREYALLSSLADGVDAFANTFPRVVGPNLLVWLFAAAGLVMLWLEKLDRATAVFASAFLLFSFFAVCPGLFFREHYFVLMLPAVSLLAGAAVRSKRTIVWLLYGAALAISIALQSDRLFSDSPVEASRQTYGLNPFPEAFRIGAYIRAHSEKDARIAVLGSEPEIFFYANRRSATGYLYVYGMMELQPFALTMQNEMVRDLENQRPEYVVVVNIPSSWGRHAASQDKILDWWNTHGAQDYDVVGVIDMLSPDRIEYHWDDAATYRPRSTQFIAIGRRKSK